MKRNVWSGWNLVWAVATGAIVASSGACGGDDGDPDPGPGPTDAGTQADAGAAQPIEEGRALTTSNGNLIVVGSTEQNPTATGVDLLVRRYTASGTLDTTFGTQGSVVVDFEGPATGAISGQREQDDRADTVAVFPDGSLLVAGFAQGGVKSDSRDFAVVKLTANGQLDTSFNKTGRSRLHFGAEGSVEFRGAVHSVLPMANGLFYVGGFLTKSDGLDEDFALIRYKADGSLDTSFTSAGSPAGSWIGGAYTNAESVQGIVLQGTSLVIGGGDDFAAVRIRPAGNQDMTFGTSGLAKSVGGRAHAMVARPSGGFLLAGERQDVKVGGTGYGVMKLVAYTAEGKPDVTFGPEGVREYTAPEDVLDVVDVSGLAIQADGKILVYANVRAKPALFRFLTNGDLDTAFGTGGVVRWPETQLTLPLFIRPTTGPKLVVSGNTAFVTDANIYTPGFFPGPARLLLKSTGL
ncbi:delta-60 repeat domain-containing protein [Corallococcus terminator]|uniref:Delta-60 repeat domain-containing protein n=1 Tax=Corallococcus terminator TaxID=2316733 RepID=A0A3A8IQY8_9BACT|nr:delta-60 repeat domain-containing protein [Corallococcus terminator]RKG85807.1 hypothetical protein D7V88_19210 [Corallococcus terminator]